MEHEITFSPEHDCYVWWYAGHGKSLDAATLEAANEEVEDLISQGIRPDMAEFSLNEEFSMDVDDFDDLDDGGEDDDEGDLDSLSHHDMLACGYTADELGFDPY